jgi:hypothetical protein
MLIKLRWVGGNQTSLTNNNVYTVLGVQNTGTPWVLDDNGAIFSGYYPWDDTSKWQPVSVTTVTGLQIYP